MMTSEAKAQSVLEKRGDVAGYGVPKMITTREGSLLLFAQARIGTTADHGVPIKSVILRSTDGGITWSRPTVLAEEPHLSYRPLSAVADLRSGRIILFINRMPLKDLDGNPLHERWVVAHPNETWKMGGGWLQMTSDDDGLSWSDPVNITSQLNPHIDTSEDIFSPNMTGIQLAGGKHAGRLIVPTRWWAGPEFIHENKRACLIYSDDGGASWQTGALSEPYLSECTVAETSTGDIYTSFRYHNDRKIRRHAISRDGGTSFVSFADDPDIPDPYCHAAITSVNLADGNRCFAFSNPADSEERVNMTVRASLDDGSSWPCSVSVYPGKAGYSALAPLDDGYAVCAFECGEQRYRENIAVARVNIRELVQ